MKRFKVEYVDWIDAETEVDAVEICKNYLMDIIKSGNFKNYVIVNQEGEGK